MFSWLLLALLNGGESMNLISFFCLDLAQRLVLKRSKIKSIDTALRFYSDLIYVDFSHSTYVGPILIIKNPFGIDLFLSLSLDRLVAIEDRSFDSQKKLTELRLGYNKISSVNNVSRFRRNISFQWLIFFIFIFKKRRALGKDSNRSRFCRSDKTTWETLENGPSPPPAN